LKHFGELQKQQLMHEESPEAWLAPTLTLALQTLRSM
jgi:hypothetical protein